MPRQITLADVSCHNKEEDLWIVVHEKVYDVTKFQAEHPGGEEVLREVAGKEATKEFDEVGHSQDAIKQMEQYYIGDLAEADKKISKKYIGIASGAVLFGLATVFIFKKLVFSRH